MIKVGLTGGIGSGKTTVARVFELLKIPVYYADIEAKKILNNNLIVKNKIITKFGNIYVNGEINREKLAKIVFNNKNALDYLNKIVHPAVINHYENWCILHKSEKYTIKEAAILFESGSYTQMDKLVSVIAPVKIRINRVVKRDNTSVQKVKDRIKTQWTDNKKTDLSDFVIKNNDKNLLIPQIIKIHNHIVSKHLEGV